MRPQENIFPQLYRLITAGRRVAIATLVNVEGTAPRPVGSMVGVAEDGRIVGGLTDGCTERAITSDALECIKQGANRIMRYGAGSPYMDIKLPCGSGIDVYFEVVDAVDVATTAHNHLVKRTPASYFIDVENLKSRVAALDRTITSETGFRRILEPETRLLCFGESGNFIALCLLALHAGFSVEAYSPSGASLDFLAGHDVAFSRIERSFDFNTLCWDRYCCAVTMFHDHDWELNILHAALNSDACYIGALGSRATHAARLAALQKMTPTRQKASVIHGPVGLDIGAQTPSEIAIAVLAQITAARRG
ncbi:MAG: XdhC family protein [Pseudomonadota bacterium]